MKFKHIVLLAVPAMLWSCGKDVENTPEAVTLAFVECMASKDFSGAADLCTKETAKEAEALEQMGSMAQEKELEKKDVKCTTEGDKATCVFCCIKGETEKSYDLEKQDGKWKVKFSKMGNAVNSLNEATESLQNLADTLTNMADTLKGAMEKVEEATGN